MKKLKGECEKHRQTAFGESYSINISLGYGTRESISTDISQVLKTAENYLYNHKLLEQKSSHSTILKSIKATMMEKSKETEEHEERLANISKQVGIKLALPQTSIDELMLLAMLHDIGKVAIDDSILNKPGRLNKDEWDIMKKHPVIGYRIAVSSPELAPIAEYILYHHERWDGKGYPQGLSGQNIPLLSRIIAVVDAYDAMTQDRPYRKAMPETDAIEEIIRNSGTQFDPEIVEAFTVCIGYTENFCRIYSLGNS